MRGFNPFRNLPGFPSASSKALATGAAASVTAAPPHLATAGNGGGRGGTGPSASAPAFAPLATPSRGLHRATHPLHLLRRHNAAAANIARIKENIRTGRGDVSGAEDTLPIVVSGGEAHGPDCPCCSLKATTAAHRQPALPPIDAATSRRSYATLNPLNKPGQSKEDVELRNRRNAKKSLNRAAAASSVTSGNPPEDPMGFANDGPVTPEERALEKEVARFVGGRLVQSLQREQPPRGSGIQPLLDYNKQWAGEIARLNNNYFSDLAQQQSPQYLWVGCSDSRVPANEIVGLYPGDVFVHRNIANIVCNSDLNALAVLQYAIDCLKVEHVIIAGHYRCGGVTAALNDDRVGLADHWILHVSAVKKRHWKRMMMDIPTSRHLDALCELNVLSQVESVVETHLVQRVWSRQNAEDALAKKEGRPSRNKVENEVEIHGWVYGLEDGVIRPLLSLTRRSNVERDLAEATEAVFWRYGQLS